MARPKLQQKQKKEALRPQDRIPKLLGLPSPDNDNDIGQGRIANSLSKMIASERNPSLFDEREITERDKELRELQELKEADVSLCIERKNKPVVLTSIQNRIVHALSYAISQELETSEDVKKKVENPHSGANQIVRVVNVSALSQLLFKSKRDRYRKQIINEIYRLSKVRQVQILSINGRTIRLTAPLISIGKTIEDISPEEMGGQGIEADFLEVMFGGAFFYGITNRFAVITPKLFDVWGKGGTGTELFSVLLSSIFSVYWHYRRAAIKAEERVRKEHKGKGKRLPKAEFEEAVAEAKQEAMSYELNVSSIKQRVTTDYDSQRSYRLRFYSDLEKAIKGFEELGILSKGKSRILRGARGQEKVIFVLSETYNFAENQIAAPSTPLLGDKDDTEPSAF